MAGLMPVNLIIGAALAGGFRSSVGGAVAGIGEIDKAAKDLSRGVMAVGQAWASLRVFRRVGETTADLEHHLTRIGIATDQSNDQLARLRDRLRALSVPTETNQSLDDLISSYDVLVTHGLKPVVAGDAIRDLGRVATATTTDINILSGAAYKMVDQLNVKPTDLTAEFGRLAIAAQQSAVGMTDIAGAMPSLSAAASALGLEGSEAVTTIGAGVAIAMKNAANPAEATANFQSFLEKIQSRATADAFRKKGLSVKKILRDALAEGENPVDALIDKIHMVTKGNPIELNRLFRDTKFLQAAVKNIDEYKALKAELTQASGKIDADYARILETTTERAKALAQANEKLGESFGSALLKPIAPAIDLLGGFITRVGEVAERMPGTALVIAALAGAAALLPPVITLATIAWGAFTASVLANPIVLAIAGIALVGAMIYDNWAHIKEFFGGLWDGVKTKWMTVVKWMSPIGAFATTIINEWEYLKSFFGTLWEDPLAAWDMAVGRIMEYWAKISEPIKAVGSFFGWGDNSQPQVGTALKTAEARGTAAMNAPAPAGGVPYPSSNGRVEVVITAPREYRTESKSSSRKVRVSSRTGPMLAGVL